MDLKTYCDDRHFRCEYCRSIVHKTQRKRHLSSSHCTFHQAIHKLYSDLYIPIPGAQFQYENLRLEGFKVRETTGPPCEYRRGWYNHRHAAMWVDAGVGYLMHKTSASAIAEAISKGEDALYYKVFEVYMSWPPIRLPGETSLGDRRTTKELINNAVQEWLNLKSR